MLPHSVFVFSSNVKGDVHVLLFLLLKYFLSPTLLRKNNLLSLPKKHYRYQNYQHWYFLNSVPSSQMYTNNTFTNYLFLKWLFLDCVEELNSYFLKQLIIRMPIRRTGRRIETSKITKPKRERKFLIVITVTPQI